MPELQQLGYPMNDARRKQRLQTESEVLQFFEASPLDSGIREYLRFHEYSISGDLKSLGKDRVEVTVRYLGERGADSFDEARDANTSSVESGLTVLAPKVIAGINPEMSARYYANLAVACETSGCRKPYAAEAVRLCSVWVTQEPQQPKAFFYLGYAFYQEEEYENAVSAIDQAIRLNPRFGIAYNLKGMVLMRLRKYPEAEEALTKAKTPNSLSNLGAVELAQGNYTSAVSYYRKAIEVDPNNAGNYSKLGMALLGLGGNENADAILSFQKALDLKPTIYPALAGLVLALARTGRADEALRRCQLAETVTSESLYPKWLEGQVWLARQDGNRSHNGSTAANILKGALDRVRAQGAFAPDLMTDLGKAYVMTDKPHLAKQTFESVINRLQSVGDSKDPEPLARAHLNLGRVLEQMGQTAKGKLEQDRAQQLDPYLRSEYPGDW